MLNAGCGERGATTRERLPKLWLRDKKSQFVKQQVPLLVAFGVTWRHVAFLLCILAALSCLNGKPRLEICEMYWGGITDTIGRMFCMGMP